MCEYCRNLTDALSLAPHKIAARWHCPECGTREYVSASGSDDYGTGSLIAALACVALVLFVVFLAAVILFP